MPIYVYKGINKQGKEIKGTLNSDTLASAKHAVKRLGVMILSINEQKSGRTVGNLSSLSGKKVNIEDLALMTRQLATLIKAKIQIVEALTALGDQVENPQLKIILSEVKQKVKEGLSLSKALSDYPKVFNQVFVNMVEAGEASGTLDIVLLRLAEFTEGQMKLKSKIVGAMTYPVVIAIVGFLMMNLIFILVIPKISKIFVSMKKELPLQTKICIWLSDVTKNYWWAILIFIFLSYYLFNKWKSRPKGRVTWDKIKLKMPVFKKLVMMIDVSRFCSTLATLLNSGVPILTSLRIVKNLISNVHIQKVVEDSKDRVSEGKSMVGPLIESGHFPAMVTHMISLGEKSGEIEPMLQIVAENYDDQIDAQLGRITALLMPFMMLLLGGAVFFVVLSVILPIMDLNSIRR